MKYILTIIAIAVLFSTASSCITRRLVVQSNEENPPALFTMPTGSKMHPAIIRLVNPDGYFYCSGVVIDAHYALTAAHCVTNSLGGLKDDEVTVYDKYNNKATTAKTVAADALRDVAFIKGDFNEFEAAAVDFPGLYLKLGMHMNSCGFPAGQFYEFCAELIHIGNRNFQIRTVGGPIFKGMSGGPVYDKESGVVIGVNSAVDENSVIISPLVGVLETVGLK